MSIDDVTSFFSLELYSIGFLLFLFFLILVIFILDCWPPIHSLCARASFFWYQ